MRYPFLSLLFCIAQGSAMSQVDAHVRFESRNNGEQQQLRINWAVSDEEEWKISQKDILEIMALKTNIFSGTLPTSPTNSTAFSFVMQTPGLIEILIEIDEITPGESLVLKDLHTEEIKFSVSNTNRKKLLLPAFNPLTTEFIWTSSLAGSYKSRFTIKSLYLQEIPHDRGGPTIGFGTALSCHPNAACKEDSMMQRISNSAVRIRMVMEEGIGWCSGSFINNTRNDRTPYVLTAYHCTFDNIPVYELWRFDMEYKSDSCANPVAEPLIYSITGCEKKAGGQASDFLLVLLDFTIPSNHQVTFAGWNRDVTATPDTSFLIHHPNADIRKISTSTNEAVIHPNQIGWSEGYTTPANHHFRFKFTEGGHQPGASGGPVFNQDGFLVGQLHGGTMGCETVNNAYIGRFAKSWDLGITPAERLKDWLDPDNTGAIEWPSIENISEGELADIHGSVLDPLGRPVRNVSIVISGSASDTVLTNAEGEFFINGINRNGNYTLVPVKNDHQANGVSALDLISIQKHLLAKDTFDFAWQHLAADATNNNNISVGDILVILRLLLGKINYFPSVTSWQFIPHQIEVDTIPVGGPFEIQLQAIKMGDVNGSADPSQ